MGHALNASIQDLKIRVARMRGQRAKWIFGKDHAGIATQRVVEKQLEADGTSREEIGREAFVERVWEWVQEYGDTISRQFRELGASLDYEDERFTMDPDYVRAVTRVFVHLYEKDLIYRDNYMVNWDPGLRTAISDLEVEQRTVEDTLYEIDYPLESGSGSLAIATVRPETMLADTAIAVNPADERYSRLVGESATPAARRPAAADHRRRVRGPGVRHRRAQDHARPRPERLRDRAPPPARGDLGDRRGRQDDRRRARALPGHGRGRGARRCGRRAARARGSSRELSRTSTTCRTRTGRGGASSR